VPFWSRKDEATPAKTTAPATPAPATGLTCSFCHKGQAEVKKLIAGEKAWICDECVVLCVDIIDEDTRKELPAPPPTVAPLLEAFAREVVGQQVACRTLAASLLRHRRNFSAEPSAGPVRVLLVGPRGCGKSTIGKVACRRDVAGVPAYHSDASRLSETGFIGENVENIVGALLGKAVDEGVARRGVLFVDGLHHLVRQVPARDTRDVSGREAQRDLVRLLDGLEIAAIRGPRHPQAPNTPVPTDRMLILAAATFDVAATDEVALREELAAKGLVDEMVSRFDVIVPMRRLTPPELRVVLDRRLDAERALLDAVGATVALGDGADLLVERAAASPDGAWALLPPLSRLRERALLEAPRAWVVDRALAAELLATR